MATEFEKGFRDIFLAGVGAMAITGEKAKEVLDTLIEKGGVTVEQGKDINRELQHKATETVAKVRGKHCRCDENYERRRACRVCCNCC